MPSSNNREHGQVRPVVESQVTSRAKPEPAGWVQESLPLRHPHIDLQIAAAAGTVDIDNI